jgi:Holliday junction resolvase
MAMAAMGAGDIVDVLLEVLAHANGACLFPGVKMDETRDFAIAEFDVEPLLEFADGLHLAVGLQQLFSAEL